MGEERSGRRLAGAALLLIVVASYLPALNAGWVWDDDDYIYKNEQLLSAAGLGRIWFEIGAVPQYYPLVHTTFWIEYRLWGLDPRGYHAVNVALHALAAVLAWHLLSRLSIPGAWIAAALFAVHPVQVESVAWVTERKNVLSTVLYLAAFLWFLRARPVDGGPPGEPRAARRAATAAFAFFVAALLSKTVAASLPAVILVVIWWKQGRIGWRDVRRVAPLVAVGIALGLVTVWTERHAVGAAGAPWALSWPQRLIIASRAVLFYLRALVWPHALSFVYPRWTVDPAVPSAWIPVAVVTGALAALWAARGRLGRGPLAAALVFGGTLFPALGFFDVYPMRYSFVADHFQYLACLAAFALVAASAARLTSSAGSVGRRVAAVTAALVLSAMALQTSQRCRAFRDDETLWRDTVAKVPEAFLAQNNLGGILLARGEVEEARRHFEAALAADPTYGEAVVNLGLVAARQGHRDEAVARFQTAIRLDPSNADAYDNLGAVLAEAGRLEEAIAAFRLAIAHRRNFAGAMYNLGVALVRAGRAAEAVPVLEEASRLSPGDADTRRALERARGPAGPGGGGSGPPV